VLPKQQALVVQAVVGLEAMAVTARLELPILEVGAVVGLEAIPAAPEVPVL
jgi:hypothetical protein